MFSINLYTYCSFQKKKNNQVKYGSIIFLKEYFQLLSLRNKISCTPYHLLLNKIYLLLKNVF